MVLNVGDVVYQHSYLNNALRQYVVARTTPRQAILNNGVRLERDSESPFYAYEIGGLRRWYFLETDALKAQLGLQKDQQEFISLMENFRKLPLAKLREINAMLAEVAEQKTA